MIHIFLAWLYHYLIAVTLDNAAPNNVLIAALSRLLCDKYDIPFVAENSQIRCLAHIVNLVVQKILAALEEADDPDIHDYYSKDVPFHYNPDDDQDLKDLENEDDSGFASDIEDEEDDDEIFEKLKHELKNKRKSKSEVNGVDDEDNGELSAIQKVRAPRLIFNRIFTFYFYSFEKLQQRSPLHLNGVIDSAALQRRFTSQKEPL